MAKRNKEKDNMFFGLDLTDEQQEFVDAIFDDNKKIILCNSKAGTGKTSISVACAKLLVSKGKYDGLVYIFSGVEESKYGYRPGSQEEKEKNYLLPLYDALITINEMPEQAIVSTSLMKPKKESTAWVEVMSHTFLRGSNIKKKFVILDECENWTVSEIKKVLTRCHNDCLVICIGHTGQIDLLNKELSGFQKYIDHFKDEEQCVVCTLSKNFRGWVANHADSLEG